MILKIKNYRCKYCGQPYMMQTNVYASRSLTGLKQCCNNVACMTEAAMFALSKKKQNETKIEKQKWKLKKLEWKFEKTKQSQEPLQKAINKIVRLIDEDETCIARPFEETSAYDAGHVYSVGSHPSLRYHLWNIHKQSVKSNKHLGGEQLLMLEGIENRYGIEIRNYVESLPKLYPILKLSIDEKYSALKKANKLIKEIESGKKYTRNEANEYLQIYINY